MDACTRLGALAALATLALSIACLPKPSKPIEWVERGDAIIIQLKTVEKPDSPLEQLVALPPFTLYGDGTLIFVRENGLEKAELSTSAIRNLLESISGNGFMDFAYEQQRPDGAQGSATYLLVQTKEAANSVRADAIEVAVPQDAGKEWQQYRRALEIIDRLRALDVSGARPYAPEQWVLFVKAVEGAPSVPAPAAWPLPDIDLTAIASGSGQTMLTNAEASLLNQTLTAGEAQLVLQGRPFTIGYRPLLPFEENFPEFDQP